MGPCLWVLGTRGICLEMGTWPRSHVLGKQYQGCRSCTGAAGQGLCTVQGSFSMRGLTPLAQLHPCPERLQHVCGCLALTASSGSYGKQQEAGAKVRSPDPASTPCQPVVTQCCQHMPRLIHHTSRAAAGARASAFVPAPVHGSAAASPRRVPGSSSSPWHLL